MILHLATIFVLVSVYICTNQQYTVQQLNGAPGFLFKERGIVKLQKGYWKAIVKLDLDSLGFQESLLRSQALSVFLRCPRPLTCQNSYNHMVRDIDATRTLYQHVKELITPSLENNTLYDPFDPHTSILPTNGISDLHYSLIASRNRSNNVFYEVDKATRQSLNMTSSQFNDTISSWAIEAQMDLRKFNKFYSSIIEALQLTLKGRISPAIITKSYVKNLHRFHNINKTLELVLSNLYSEEYCKNVNISIMRRNNTVQLSYTFDLFDKTPFTLYQIYPVNTNLTDGSQMTITPKADYIATTTSDSYHVFFQQRDLEQCIDRIYCHEPAAHFNQETCKHRALETRDIFNCNLQRQSTSILAWRHVEDSNTYIFCFQDDHLIDIRCDDETKQLFLHESGIITIGDNCLIDSITSITNTITSTTSTRKPNTLSPTVIDTYTQPPTYVTETTALTPANHLLTTNTPTAITTTISESTITLTEYITLPITPTPPDATLETTHPWTNQTIIIPTGERSHGIIISLNLHYTLITLLVIFLAIIISRFLFLKRRKQNRTSQRRSLQITRMNSNRMFPSTPGTTNNFDYVRMSPLKSSRPNEEDNSEYVEMSPIVSYYKEPNPRKYYHITPTVIDTNWSNENNIYENFENPDEKFNYDIPPTPRPFNPILTLRQTPTTLPTFDYRSTLSILFEEDDSNPFNP